MKKTKIGSLPYRPDIDGLRALAVIVVMIYHLFPGWVRGGFVGVDIFFVISGYLISSIIFTSLKADNFSFSDFYIRRIKRIFPALLVVLLFVSVAGWIISLPGDFRRLGEMINATTTFSANISFMRGSAAELGYFDRGTVYKPLLHIWSLSLEEQFYIIFPLAVFLMYKVRKFLLPSFLLIFFVSFALNILFIETKPSKVFFLPPGRAWEFLMGSLLAYIKIFSLPHSIQKIEKYKTYLSNWLVQNIISSLALGMILYACFMFKETKLFPGWLALMPTVGALLLIVAENSWINQKVLAHETMVRIGLISYALYLWHWPLISLMTLYNNGELSIFVRISIFLSSFLLAGLTTFYIERPIRYSSQRNVYSLSAGMVFMFALSLGIKREYIKSLPVLTNPELSKIDFAINDWDYPTKILHDDDKRNFPFKSFGEGQKIIFFFGDSNLEQYWPRVEKLMLKNQNLRKTYTVVFASLGGQIPLLNAPISPAANFFLTKVDLFLKERTLDTVVIGAQWIGYFQLYKERAEQYFSSLENMLLSIKNSHAKTYMILNAPISISQDPRYIFKKRGIFPWEINRAKMYDSAEWLSCSQKITNRLKTIAKITGTIVIDPYKTLCPNNQCIIFDSNNFPIYKDAGHLSATYVRENAIFIDQIFDQK